MHDAGVIILRFYIKHDAIKMIKSPPTESLVIKNVQWQYWIKCQGNKNPYTESLFTSSSAKALIPANRSFSACFLALNSAKEKLHDHRTSKDWNKSQNVIFVRYHLLPTHQESQLFLWYFFLINTYFYQQDASVAYKVTIAIRNSCGQFHKN